MKKHIRTLLLLLTVAAVFVLSVGAVSYDEPTDIAVMPPEVEEFFRENGYKLAYIGDEFVIPENEYEVRPSILMHNGQYHVFLGHFSSDNSWYAENLCTAMNDYFGLYSELHTTSSGAYYVISYHYPTYSRAVDVCDGVRMIAGNWFSGQVGNTDHSYS